MSKGNLFGRSTALCEGFAKFLTHGNVLIKDFWVHQCRLVDSANGRAVDNCMC